MPVAAQQLSPSSCAQPRAGVVSGRLAEVRPLPLRPRVPAHVLRARRLGATLVLVMVVGAVVTTATLASAPAPQAPPTQAAWTPTAVVTVVVGPGETVWEVAHEHLPAGRDLREYVADIVEHNAIDPARLRPGSVLRLPQR